MQNTDDAVPLSPDNDTDEMDEAMEAFLRRDTEVGVIATAFVLSVNSLNELPAQSRNLFAEIVVAVISREMAAHKVDLIGKKRGFRSMGTLKDVLVSNDLSWVAEFAPDGAMIKLAKLFDEGVQLGYYSHDELEDGDEE